MRGTFGKRPTLVFYITSARWKFVEAGNAVRYHMIGLFLAAIDGHVWHAINILIIETADFDEHSTFHTGALRDDVCTTCPAEFTFDGAFKIITRECAWLSCSIGKAGSRHTQNKIRATARYMTAFTTKAHAFG